MYVTCSYQGDEEYDIVILGCDAMSTRRSMTSVTKKYVASVFRTNSSVASYIHGDILNPSKFKC